MSKRAATVEQTRERIVAATVEAHRELGIQATSWEEIARRAGVGIGTVYRHFRSLEDLLPACGQIVEQIMALPTADEIHLAFEQTSSIRSRTAKLVFLVFDLYERAGPFIHNIDAEREQLPQLEPWHRTINSTLDALLEQALRPLEPNRAQLQATRALLDLRTWQAFTQRNLSNNEITAIVSGLIDALLE